MVGAGRGGRSRAGRPNWELQPVFMLATGGCEGALTTGIDALGPTRRNEAATEAAMW